jgi:transcriptional regulator with XRE-family HTH domain
MNGETLKDIRNELDLTVVDFGLALGYTGNDNTISDTVRKYERGKKDIPPWIARLAIALVTLHRHQIDLDQFEREVELFGN